MCHFPYRLNQTWIENAPWIGERRDKDKLPGSHLPQPSAKKEPSALLVRADVGDRDTYARAPRRNHERGEARGLVTCRRFRGEERRSPRRLMQVGCSLGPALLALEPLHQLDHPEAFAELVGEAGRKQQSAMLAAPTDG